MSQPDSDLSNVHKSDGFHAAVNRGYVRYIAKGVGSGGYQRIKRGSMRPAIVASVVSLLLPLAWDAHAQSSKQVLFHFDKRFDLKHPVTDHGCRWERSPSGAPALRIITPAGRDWPGVMLKAPGGKWDLSAYEYISVDIHNVDDKDLDVFVRVDNPDADGLRHCVTERTFVAPDQRTTITVPIKRVNNSPIKLWGMIGYPQGLYPGESGLDPANISAVVVFTGRASASDNKFEISNVYAAGRFQPPTWLEMSEAEFFPFVDTFGQFKHKDWPGKIHREQELIAARNAEAKALDADPGPKEWSRYGGWANGPKLEATGHFRVAKHDGKWWLVDPEGHLFFSTGLTCVDAGWAATPIEDRLNWFEGLPPNEGPTAQFYSKTYRQFSGRYAGKEPVVFDHSKVNLQRKYGDDWQKVYPDIVHRRLRAWGINTMGNWSNTQWGRMQKTPYTAPMYYSARKLRSTHSGFPDPFDPKFNANLTAAAKQWVTPFKDDPYCIGFFVDNEMPWGGPTTLAIEALKAPADQPAKLELIKFLQGKYSDIAALNAAWGTQYEGFDKLPVVSGALKNPPSTEAAIADLTAFTDRISEAYLKGVRDAIKAVAPNKLYLGCRSVGGSVNVMRMQAQYCDVISMNRYCHQVRDVKLPGGIDAPVLIGEFHFGASDRGLFWNGLVSTDDQADRGRKYADYVNSALDNPQLVGVHWFQYGDEAVTGRGDGENAQCGFVDVCDTPYAETVAAARATADQMYQRRAKAKVDPRPKDAPSLR